MQFHSSHLARGAFSVAFRVVIACVALCSSAFAQVEQNMLTQFNAMMNVTPGGVYETQAARVVTGGSFMYRPRVSTLRLLSVDPPRLKAGCNGIDAYTGSLSFISEEAFINFLRNLAGSAPAYAFSMALSYLCKDCDQHLARLQKLAQDINGLTTTNCRFDYEGLMTKKDTIMKDLDKVAESGTALGRYWKGMVNDGFKPAQEAQASWDKIWKEARAGSQDAKDVRKQSAGNIAFIAAQKGKVAEWWGAAGNVQDRRLFSEIVTSVTGTFVAGSMPTKDDNNVDRAKTAYLPPLLSFRDFFDGAKNVSIYKCQDDGDDDLCAVIPNEDNKADTQQKVDIPSFRQMVRDLLYGQNQDGVVYQLNARASRGAVAMNDPRVKAFLSSLPSSLYAELVNLSSFPAAAAGFADIVADWVAAEAAYSFLSEAIKNVRTSARTTPLSHLSSSFDEKLSALEREIKAERDHYATQTQVLEAQQKIADHIKRSIVKATSYGVRPGSLGPQR